MTTLKKPCGFCNGGPVGDAATWLDGVSRPPAPCPRCGETYVPVEPPAADAARTALQDAWDGDLPLSEEQYVAIVTALAQNEAKDKALRFLIGCAIDYRLSPTEYRSRRLDEAILAANPLAFGDWWVGWTTV